MDPRIKQLAENLIAYSTHLSAGDKVLIDCSGHDALPLVDALVKEAYAAQAEPFVTITEPSIQRTLLKGAGAAQLERQAAWALTQMKEMDAYIAIRASQNTSEFSDIPKAQLTLQAKKMSPVLRHRVDHTRWVVLRYPNPSMAQLAGMSTEQFESFYFDVCNLDYARMSRAMDALVQRMNATDQVRLVAPGTDLTFSIKDIPAVKCAGECNIPDGEVYTAPVKDSVNGTICYNAPSLYQGTSFTDVSFTFENGRIVAANANEPDALAHILDTDDGARFIGEFAIGVNPYILHPMKDILFDEKIAGSIHFTPGACYEDAPNGNKSDVHWDLVLIMRPEYGGGAIYFDDVLIRKDGLFVPADLQCLNPDALID